LQCFAGCCAFNVYAQAQPLQYAYCIYTVIRLQTQTQASLF